MVLRVEITEMSPLWQNFILVLTAFAFISINFEKIQKKTQ
jgi:hypothetical protein|tara:strand:+ start:1282 stop:1401 length:120 start_codon:yes stop_codon:yes gene_type:complete